MKSATYRAVLLIGSCVLLSLARCSVPDELEPGTSALHSTGGSVGNGGSSGGALSGGGSSAGGVPTGGLPATGGVGGAAPNTGGTLQSGGSGGAETGGAAPTGGTAGSGGAGGTGGATGGAGGATGGAGGTGGATGGAGGTGGTPPVGFVYKSLPAAKCRDGSAAGYFIKEGAPSKNLMIFLEGGGGVCFDSFLCSVAPKNVNESVDGETLLQMGLRQTPQRPPVEGIFKADARNPVRDWNMIYVPYCTGDVHAGTKANGTIAGVNTPQQFVGYTNFGLFLEDYASKFQDADKVLLAGASGGSYGALINADRTIPAFPNSTLYVVSDSGVPFDDQYLEPCLQKIWRDLWGLNGALPAACTGCFQADGGGIAKGLSKYLYDKYQGRVLGGFVSSNQDDVVKGFYGKGLNTCQPSILFPYPNDRYPNGLHNVRDTLTDKARTSSYFLNMINHVHLYRTRYYENNGLSMSLAAWLDQTLQGHSVHVGD